MNNIRKYLSYKRVPDMVFPWSFEALMDLPLFMIYHIYEMLDEFIEADKQKYNEMNTRYG